MMFVYILRHPNASCRCLWLPNSGSCTEEWDDENRCDDDEYYAYVESADLTTDPAEYMVQDVEEAAGLERVAQNRH